MSSLHEEQVGKFTIKLDYDQDCQSPLDDDGVKITYKKGSRYILGNEPVEQEEYDALRKRLNARRPDVIGLPVYAYVHSGTYLRTGPWNGLLPEGHAEFDSGHSGFVYVTKKTALEWMGGKVLSASKRARVLKSLETAVDEFSKYLNGECYYYTIEDEDGNNVDSTGGYIGFDYALQEARDAAQFYVKQDIEQRHKAWRAALREARERKYWVQRGVVTQ